jgi:hypothetical protein
MKLEKSKIMKKKHRLIVLVWAVGVIVGILCIAQQPGDEGSSSDLEYLNFFKSLWKMMENKDLSISGTVVDEGNHPLANVEMEINRFTSTGFGRSDHQVQMQRINGNFAVEGSNVSTIRLRFTRNGYYPLEVSFEANEDKKTQGITVMMEKQVEPVPMEFSDDRILFKAVGRGAVIDFTTMDNLDKNQVYIGFKQVESFNPQADNGDSVRNGEQTKKNTLPARGIYLEADVEDGKIAFITRDLNGHGLIKPIPRAVRLVMIHPVDGFVLTNIDTKEFTTDVFRRLMKEAPVDGYVRSISVPPRKNDYYFYFKVGDRYGKGMYASNEDYHEDRVENAIWLRCQTSPSSGRNVATDE